MSPLEPGPHVELLDEALELEAAAQRALLDGDVDAASAGMGAAAACYRASWAAAPPRSFGRLIGMLKAAVLAGDAREAARYARGQLGDSADSAPSAYALAIAALVDGDDALATQAAERMRGGSPAFDRTAAAITAIAAGDAARYASELSAIVASFEQREEHLTGVPIADTALMLDALAAPRGLSALPPRSPVLPRR